MAVLKPLFYFTVVLMLEASSYDLRDVTRYPYCLTATKEKRSGSRDGVKSYPYSYLDVLASNPRGNIKSVRSSRGSAMDKDATNSNNVDSSNEHADCPQDSGYFKSPEYNVEKESVVFDPLGGSQERTYQLYQDMNELNDRVRSSHVLVDHKVCDDHEEQTGNRDENLERKKRMLRRTKKKRKHSRKEISREPKSKRRKKKRLLRKLMKKKDSNSASLKEKNEKADVTLSFSNRTRRRVDSRAIFDMLSLPLDIYAEAKKNEDMKAAEKSNPKLTKSKIEETYLLGPPNQDSKLEPKSIMSTGDFLDMINNNFNEITNKLLGNRNASKNEISDIALKPKEHNSVVYYLNRNVAIPHAQKLDSLYGAQSFVEKLRSGAARENLVKDNMFDASTSKTQTCLNSKTTTCKNRTESTVCSTPLMSPAAYSEKTKPIITSKAFARTTLNMTETITCVTKYDEKMTSSKTSTASSTHATSLNRSVTVDKNSPSSTNNVNTMVIPSASPTPMMSSTSKMILINQSKLQKCIEDARVKTNATNSNAVSLTTYPIHNTITTGTEQSETMKGNNSVSDETTPTQPWGSTKYRQSENSTLPNSMKTTPYTTTLKIVRTTTCDPSPVLLEKIVKHTKTTTCIDQYPLRNDRLNMKYEESKKTKRQAVSLKMLPVLLKNDVDQPLQDGQSKKIFLYLHQVNPKDSAVDAREDNNSLANILNSNPHLKFFLRDSNSVKKLFAPAYEIGFPGRKDLSPKDIFYLFRNKRQRDGDVSDTFNVTPDISSSQKKLIFRNGIPELNTGSDSLKPVVGPSGLILYSPMFRISFTTMKFLSMNPSTTTNPNCTTANMKTTTSTITPTCEMNRNTTIKSFNQVTVSTTSKSLNRTSLVAECSSSVKSRTTGGFTKWTTTDGQSKCPTCPTCPTTNKCTTAKCPTCPTVSCPTCSTNICPSCQSVIGQTTSKMYAVENETTSSHFSFNRTKSKTHVTTTCRPNLKTEIPSSSLKVSKTTKIAEITTLNETLAIIEPITRKSKTAMMDECTTVKSKTINLSKLTTTAKSKPTTSDECQTAKNKLTTLAKCNTSMKPKTKTTANDCFTMKPKSINRVQSSTITKPKTKTTPNDCTTAKPKTTTRVQPSTTTKSKTKTTANDCTTIKPKSINRVQPSTTTKPKTKSTPNDCTTAKPKTTTRVQLSTTTKPTTTTMVEECNTEKSKTVTTAVLNTSITDECITTKSKVVTKVHPNLTAEPNTTITDECTTINHKMILIYQNTPSRSKPTTMAPQILTLKSKRSTLLPRTTTTCAPCFGRFKSTPIISAKTSDSASIETIATTRKVIKCPTARTAPTTPTICSIEPSTGVKPKTTTSTVLLPKIRSHNCSTPTAKRKPITCVFITTCEPKTSKIKRETSDNIGDSWESGDNVASCNDSEDSSGLIEYWKEVL